MHSLPGAPLLVLDTNVVLDWVAFDDPRSRRLAASIESGAWRVATTADCLAELRRALAYPQVKLELPAQARSYARYLEHAQCVELPGAAIETGLPRCEDRDDQKFLELAWHAGASHLITRDKALLKLANKVARLGRFSVQAPDIFALRMFGLAIQF